MTVQVLDGFMSAEQCAALIATAERLGFAATKTQYPDAYRNNDRLVFDSPELAAKLFEQFKRAVPDTSGVGFNSRAAIHDTSRWGVRE